MRTLLLVLDGVGCGHAPDAAAFGDEGANTLRRILETGTHLPALENIGLHAILALSETGKLPAGTSQPTRFALGVLRETSASKDTTTGHWELAGAPLERPFPVFEQFPSEWLSALEQETGVHFLGNFAASGTEILEQLGEEHLATGHPILYTSADSVLQIAAHEDIWPVERLYEICRIARRHADALGIARVIARPFVGKPGAFQRTPRRHDFSLRPPYTLLNALCNAGIPVTGIGKIADIFAHSGITDSFSTESNAHGMETIDRLWDDQRSGLLFANLVDFDTLFGHRRDVAGYARALAEFDAWLTSFLPRVADDDLVLITADHGNDPAWRGTDHTREQVPLWVLGAVPMRQPGLRRTFADVAASLAQRLLNTTWPVGKSFLEASGSKPSQKKSAPAP